MTKEEILTAIKKENRFVYHPQRWSDETEAALKQLTEKGIIMNDPNEKMNPDYIYILK